MKSIILITIFLLLLISSCSDNSINSHSDIHKSIFPLSVGNYWIYENKYYYSSFNLDSQDEVENDTLSVIGEMLSNGTKYYDVDGDILLYNNNDGLNALVKDNGKEHLMFMWPAKVGDSYLVPDLNDSNPVEVRVKSTNIIVSVPAGNFNCVCYEFKRKANNERILYYLSVGVGIIKYETYKYHDDNNSGSTDKLFNEYTLQSYKVK